jgi:hypothetical protein
MRKAISTRERIRLFALHGGICHLCECRIMPGEDWDISHEIALALTGADDDANRMPAHRKCHRVRTRDDMGAIAKAKRREAKHIGAWRSKSPLPGGKASPWKRKVNGEVVRRFDD